MNGLEGRAGAIRVLGGRLTFEPLCLNFFVHFMNYIFIQKKVDFLRYFKNKRIGPRYFN